MNTVSKTIFDVPVLSVLLRIASIVFLTTCRFRYKNTIQGRSIPDKFVLIGAPHTSLLDVPFMLMVSCALRLPPVFWTAKKELFRFPFGCVLLWLGGIPVDRSTNNKTVDQLSLVLAQSTKPMCIMFAPEGTRYSNGTWRTGFYHTAMSSNVPIVLGYLDYSRSRGGVAGIIDPSGNIDKDIGSMKQFYEPIKKRNI